MTKQVCVALAALALAGMNGAARAAMSPMHHSNTGSNATDRMFTRMVAMGNTAEIQLSKVALRKSSNPHVKRFAQMMIRDHSAMGSALAITARSNRLPAPMTLDPMHRSLRARLMRMSGKSFDSAYLSAMINDHAKAVTLFQNEMAHGQNIHVTNLATKNVGAVQNHLQMAHDLTGTQSKMGAKIKTPPTQPHM